MFEQSNEIPSIDLTKKKRGELKDIIKLGEDNNTEEAESILEQNFALYNKKLSSFFTNFSNIFDEEKKKGRFRELRAYKLHMLNGINKAIENLHIEDAEKDELLFRTNLFYLMHSTFEKNAQGLCPCIDGKKVKNGNEHNIACAKAQQYAVMSIITKPETSLKLFEDYKKVAKNIYNNEKIFNGIKVGVYGMAGAYHYYNEKGYKVIMPNPKLDACQEIDLILVDDKNINSGLKKKIVEIDWMEIDNLEKMHGIDKELKKFIYKVQVKSHSDSNRPTEEIEFDDSKDKEVDYYNKNDGTAKFFKAQGVGTGFKCKYFDISFADAKKYINENLDSNI